MQPRRQLPGDRQQQQRQIAHEQDHRLLAARAPGRRCGGKRAHDSSAPPHALRLDRLLAHQVPGLVHLLDEGLLLEDVGIVLVELGVHDGLDAARPRRHHRHAVGEIDRLLHVVGDEDHGLRRALPDAQQLALHQPAGLRVERAERLVHQQDLGIEGERARDRGALLHAAGKLRGVAVLEAVQADQLDEIAARASRARPSACPAVPARRGCCRARSSRETARNAGTRCRGRGRAPATGLPSTRMAPVSTGRKPPIR